MNWKFWTWPRQIRELQERNAQQLGACATAALCDTEESFKAAQCPRTSPFWSPAYEDVRRRTAECIELRKSGGWHYSFDIAPFYARLASLDANDPLYPLLLGFLDAQIVSQAEIVLDKDSHATYVGRVQMCAALKRELANAWIAAHAPPAK